MNRVGFVCLPFSNVQDNKSTRLAAGPAPSGQLLQLPDVEAARSCDDLLSASQLVTGGRFGGRQSVPAVEAAVPFAVQRTARRPSIFRRCYSSESNAIVPSWFSGTQQASAGQSEVASSAVVLINPSQPADPDALVDCLPPYYWEAKHMPRLVKVSIVRLFLSWTLKDDVYFLFLLLIFPDFLFF